MTINLSTPIKYIASIGVTALLVAATIYADEITTLSQTAKSGDKITHEWVNAVSENSKVNAATNANYFCVAANIANIKNYGMPNSMLNSDNGTFMIITEAAKFKVTNYYGYDNLSYAIDSDYNNVPPSSLFCYGAR